MEEGEAVRARHRDDKERNREATRRYQQRHPERVAESNRASHLMAYYGITNADYAARLAEQGGVCAICGRPERQIHPRSGVVQSLSVDHDHKTGEVRGLLCSRCNRLVGRAEAVGDPLFRYLGRA